MPYTIHRLKNPDVWGQDRYEQLFQIPAGLEKAEINQFPWKENEYTPVSAAYLGWNEAGLQVYMYSLETSVRTVETKTGGSVCQDSCLEFFLNPSEQKAECYLNYECSALPCVHLGKGTGRHGRSVFQQIPGGMAPECRKVPGEGWGIHYTVTAEFLQKEFGTVLESGHRMWGNFYKCGDLTEFPHYGIWHEMDLEKVPQADYHRPEYFGELVLE